LGVLALMLAGLMCPGLVMQLLNGKFSSLGGFVVVGAVCGVGLNGSGAENALRFLAEKHSNDSQP
jgi:hypothetical protein